MLKRIIGSVQPETESLDLDWLDVESLAEVEITSEDPAHPIEFALLPGQNSGWRAASPGPQTIRLIFTRPQRLQRIFLKFVETGTERTQEYVLRWSGNGGHSFHDIVRQQWNFSPPDASCETEIHHVDLPAVTVLELHIVPDISGGTAIGSLEQLRLA